MLCFALLIVFRCILMCFTDELLLCLSICLPVCLSAGGSATTEIRPGVLLPGIHEAPLIVVVILLILIHTLIQLDLTQLTLRISLTVLIFTHTSQV